LDFDTTSNNCGIGRSPRSSFPDFPTGTSTRTDLPHQQPVGEAEADFRIPAGSRKTALVYLALAAWRADLLDPSNLGEVRGRQVDEAQLQRALYRSSMGEIEHALGPLVKGKHIVVEGHIAGTGRTALERMGAEVEELRLEDEKRYIDMTPAIFVFAAVAMAIRYISLGLDDQDLYILAGILFALMYGLRPFFFKMQRPRDD